MSDRSALLKKYYDAAMEQLAAVNNDASLLEEPYRTVALVQAAQGVIDNGGLIYFFESDWPGQPPYKLFSDAYRRIGKPEAANDIDTAAASFGVDQPEKHRELRQAFMDTQFGTEDEDGEEVEGLFEVTWTDRILGDDTVWDALEAWVKKHSG